MFIHPGDLLDSVYFISRGSVEIIHVGDQAYQDRMILGILSMIMFFLWSLFDFLGVGDWIVDFAVVEWDDLSLGSFGSAKHDIFGGCPTDFIHNKISQSRYGVHAVGFVDLNKITLYDLKDILFMYPEWSASFLNSFKITFKLNEVSME